MKLLETILVTQGKLHHLDYHQQRLNRSFLKLFHKLAPYELEKILTPPQDNQTYRCRVVYDQADIDISYLPYTPTHKRSYQLLPIDFDYDDKYLDRSDIDQAVADLEEGCEAIFIKNNLITDSSIANVACFIDNQWLTPKRPLLQGTTRQRLLDEEKLIPADICVEDFKKADKLAFFNALTGFYELPIST